jgi:hypothetical protein
MSQKSYKQLFVLADKNPFLKNTVRFKATLLYADTLYKKCIDYVNNGELEDSKRYIKQIMLFPQYEQEAIKIMKRIENITLFYTYLSNKNYLKMYHLVGKYPFLQELSEYKSFIHDVDNAIKQSEHKDISTIIAISRPYKNIPIFQERFGKIIAYKYFQQLMLLLKHKTIRKSLIVNALNNYVSIFGVTDQVIFYIAKLESSNIHLTSKNDTSEQIAKPNYTKWVNLELEDEILT